MNKGAFYERIAKYKQGIALRLEIRRNLSFILIFAIAIAIVAWSVLAYSPINCNFPSFPNNDVGKITENYQCSVNLNVNSSDLINATNCILSYNQTNITLNHIEVNALYNTFPVAELNKNDILILRNNGSLTKIANIKDFAEGEYNIVFELTCDNGNKIRIGNRGFSIMTPRDYDSQVALPRYGLIVLILAGVLGSGIIGIFLDRRKPRIRKGSIALLLIILYYFFFMIHA